jgi:dUTP pyrophosphatase
LLTRIQYNIDIFLHRSTITVSIIFFSPLLILTLAMSFYRRAPLQIKKLSDQATIPTPGSDLAAGLDLSSAQTLTIPQGGRALVATDLSVACPPGTYARIAPRSGLALKHGIDVGAGVIDADYRGPVGVILFNWGDKEFEIQQGDRIAQLILEQIVIPDIQVVDELCVTERGEGGFGSTGVVACVEKKQRLDGNGAVPAEQEESAISAVTEEERSP